MPDDRSPNTMMGPVSLLLVAILFGWIAPNLQSQTMEDLEHAVQQGTRLKAIEIGKKIASADPRMAGVLGQFLPLVSDYTVEFAYETIQTAAIQHKDYVAQATREIAEDRAKFHSAIDKILDLSNGRRVVILNEAHDMPQHRAFALLLAKELKSAGFEYLAMETLTRPDYHAGLVKFEYPQLNSGYYSKEPVFGDFLRHSNRLGYKLVAYEQELDQQGKLDPADQFGSIIEREKAQCDNLLKHVLERAPDTRVLIFVGYDHAKETWQKLEDGRELGWMAAQLARNSGIDPLTIDQVGGSYNPKLPQVDPMLKIIEKTGRLKESSIIEMGDGGYAVSDRYRGAIDLTVFHPVQTMIDGRPDWLRMGGYRVPHEIENKIFFLDGPTLVQAFVETEMDEPIPVDQVLIESEKGMSRLLLPPGSYRLVSEGPGGRLKTGPQISVEREDEKK